MNSPNTFNRNFTQKSGGRMLAALFLAAALLAFFPNLFAQAIYQGPAFGSIAGGAPVSTGQFDNVPQTIDPQKRIHNLLWHKSDPLPIEDRYNVTPPSAPAGSNWFIDPAVSGEQMEPNPPAVLIDFQANSMTNSIPPDPIVAAGPNHIIAMVNTNFHIFDKQGTLLFQRTADQWFSNVLPYAGLFDPIVLYDHFDDRWIQVWDLQDNNDQTGYWLVSISDDSDPMGTWYNFSFPAHLNGSTPAGNWGDYEKAGYDHQAVYISGRMFTFAGFFQYSKMRIIPKSELYANTGGAVNYTDFWGFRDPANPGSFVDGPPIAVVPKQSLGNKAYMVVDAPYTTSTFITLWTINNPLSPTPTLSAVNIPTVAAPWPNNGNQLGGGSPRIEVGRRAYRNAVYSDGHIWTSTAIGGGAGNLYTFARYLRLNVNTNTAVEDVALGANNFYYLYPAAMVDDQNNLVMVFTRSGDSEYAGAAFTGRKEGDPPGLSPSVMLKEGEGNYVVTFGSNRNRWGDYMGIAPDPQYPNVIWGLIEYAAATNTWGNWVGAFAYNYYGVEGVVKDAVSGSPIELAHLTVPETGNSRVTDASGVYQLFVPIQNITIDVSAFAYQSVSVPLSLVLNDTLQQDISLQPEIQALFSGQVKDATTGAGVPAELEFWVEGNPYPGPYQAFSTDPNGNFSFSTIIGTYDIVVRPQSPYAFGREEDVVLGAGGLAYDIEVSPAEVMLVDDDKGSPYEAYYISALEELARTYHYWDVQTDGVPSAADMAAYPKKLAVWYTGDGVAPILDAAEQEVLLAHLNNGGRVFLTGQNIAEEINGSDLLNQLGVGYLQDNAQAVVRGSTGSLMAGIIFVVNGSGGANNQTSKDQLTINNTATTQQIFQYGGAAADVAGVTYESGDARALFLGFGWEGIGDPVKRSAVLAKVLEFLDTPVGIGDQPALSGPAERFELAQNYPNPFNPATTIRFSVPQRSRVELAVFNTLGQKVRTLAIGDFAPGAYEYTWDGRDDSGNPVTSGIYFYKMAAAGKFSEVKKLVLMK